MTILIMFYQKNFPWRIFVIFMVACIWEVQYVQSLSHQSNLCKPKDMPCRKENAKECYMKYYKVNSADCRDLAFYGSPKLGPDSLGNVQIAAYQYTLKSYKQTALNITFKNIAWDHLKFRFQQEDDEMKNTCREFHMSSNSTGKDLFYDCLWSNENYEGKTFSFEYEATRGKNTAYKKYSFRVPLAKNIDEATALTKWETFVLVEPVSSAFGKTMFTIHWQPLPEKFSIKSYYVIVYSDSYGPDAVKYLARVICSKMIACKYNYSRWFGNVQFGIQPACGSNSKCFISKSAAFLLGGKAIKLLLVSIASVVLIIPAIIYLTYLLKDYCNREPDSYIQEVPKVLVIFSPSVPQHVNIVFMLANYLQLYCRVEILIDDFHIFYSGARDPFRWCNDAFNEADLVMVVASPYFKHLKVVDSYYQNTDLLLLRMLRYRLSLNDKMRYFVLMLPYCSENDIPLEAICFKRFYFPDDLNKMLRYIHQVGFFSSLFRPEIPGGKNVYRLMGRKLNSAIAVTYLSLKKNKANYERLIRDLQLEEDDSSQAMVTYSSSDEIEEYEEQQREDEPKEQQKEDEPKEQQKEDKPKEQQKEDKPKEQQKEDKPKEQQKEDEPKEQQKEDEPKEQQKEDEPKIQQKEDKPKVHRKEFKLIEQRKEFKLNELRKEDIPKVHRKEFKLNEQRKEDIPKVHRKEFKLNEQRKEDIPKIHRKEFKLNEQRKEDEPKIQRKEFKLTEQRKEDEPKIQRKEFKLTEQRKEDKPKIQRKEFKLTEQRKEDKPKIQRKEFKLTEQRKEDKLKDQGKDYKSKEQRKEFIPMRKIKTTELSPDLYEEFPGPIDDLNLSGEEDNFMKFRRMYDSGDPTDLDVLEL